MTDSPDLAGLLKREALTVGTLMVSPGPTFAAAAAGCGLDFVFLDTEHVPLDRGALQAACSLYRALKLPPLVRIPQADATLARQALDAGACGIVASYMEEVEQVQELRKACKLKPLQGERLRQAMEDPVRFAAEFPDTDAFVKSRGDRIALVINVESQRAIDNLEAMLAVPGVDAILVGPHDLSVNLGVPEDFESPVFQSALRVIFAKARAAGVGAGIHQGMPPSTPGMTPDVASAWIAAGCNVYVHSADVGLFADGLQSDLARVRGGAAVAEPAVKKQKT